MLRLGLNIDHVATLRNARGEKFPSVIEAALVAESNGADLITAHLREDRRHMRDADIVLLKQTIKTELNLEIAATDAMLDFALEVKPDFVCIVPENRNEITTEGGLNVIDNFKTIERMVKTLQSNGIRASIFIDADEEQIKACRDFNTYAIEIHTGKYANARNIYHRAQELARINGAANFADSLGVVINAGHGLDYHNVMPIARISCMNELNIGFAIIAQSIFYGLPTAVKTMKDIMLKEHTSL